MKVKIAKWGNSLAVRLPKRLADELDLGLAHGRPGEQGNYFDLRSPRSPITVLKTSWRRSSRATSRHRRLGPDVGAEILPERTERYSPTDEEMGVAVATKRKRS